MYFKSKKIKLWEADVFVLRMGKWRLGKMAPILLIPFVFSSEVLRMSMWLQVYEWQ